MALIFFMRRYFNTSYYKIVIICNWKFSIRERKSGREKTTDKIYA